MRGQTTLQRFPVPVRPILSVNLRGAFYQPWGGFEGFAQGSPFADSELMDCSSFARDTLAGRPGSLAW
jgi:hypothetical protein